MFGLLQKTISNIKTKTHKQTTMIKRILNWFRNKKCSEMSFMQAFELTELPVITFYQNGNKYNLLLDTGSSANVIDKNVLKNLEYTMYEGTGNLTGMDGILHTVKACDIAFNYKNVTYNYQYLIKDLKTTFDYIKKETGVTLHGIIGTKFFAEYKYVLDFDKLIAYSKA